jgi:enoyl-CoA hydratase/carnithine racemase
MMVYKTLVLNKEEGFATITMNRPDKLNALNAEVVTELIQAFLEVGQDEKIKAVIFTGAGRAFCSGAELSSADFRIADPAAAMKLGETAMHLIMTMKSIPKPVIGAINGFAVGGGCNLALSCDIIIASEKAKFIQPYMLRAAHPDFGGIYYLPRMVGIAKANDLLFSGRTVDAAEADRIGLISRVVPADQLENVTRELAKNIAKGSALVISLTKASINQSLLMDLPTTLNHEAVAQSVVFMTEDFKESMTAFVEKREPVFKGH